MGSLPNLHELEQIEQRHEREQKRLQRERLLMQRARKASGERERLDVAATQRKSTAFNIYLMSGKCASNGNPVTRATGGGGGGVVAPTTTALGYGPDLVDAATLLDMDTARLLSRRQLLRQQEQRHSLTGRHTVQRPTQRSTWDEQMLEHFSTYSPSSMRSHRLTPVSGHQVQAALAASRRRESINSSIDTTSIRRLLTLNNRSHNRHKVPAHVRQKVFRQFTCLTLSHGLMCAVLWPLFALQASNSIWHHRERWLHIVDANIGSMLLGITFLMAAITTLLATRCIRRFGHVPCIVGHHLIGCIYLLCHFYPSIYILLPAYILLGITLAPATISRIAMTAHFGSKLSCSQNECTLMTAAAAAAAAAASAHTLDANDDQHKMYCNRDQKVRRLVRWLQAANDLGLIAGAIVAALVFACTSDDWNCLRFDDGGITTIRHKTVSTTTTTTNTITITTTTATTTTPTISSMMPTPAAFHAFRTYALANFWPHISSSFDDNYNHNDQGQRICGAVMCPTPSNDADMTAAAAATPLSNDTFYAHFINDSNGRSRDNILIAIYSTFALLALIVITVGGRVETTFRQERIRGLTDTLLFAGPMAFFIGAEQAYMLGDFLRAFVSCSLGLNMVAGVLIGMGIMQAIVSCTLSMLLRHTKRIVIIVAGFFFHSCLLLAIARWKPSSDDSALFYVLAASWGACNAMWETLLLALITINHTNHVTEVSAPLHGLRFLGLAITFAGHSLLCETPKIVILVVILVISVPPYAMLEIRLEGQRKAHIMNL